MTEFWSGKRVLITGHTGFKGSWLSLWLKDLGAEVYGYALAAPTSPSLFDIIALDQHITSIEGDVRDHSAIVACVKSVQPDIVIHMAAQSLVQPSYEDPVDTFSSNIMGTVNVLDAVRQSSSVKVALMITSDKCYENQERAEPYQEDDPMGGYDPYSASKGCAELVTSSYRRSFFEQGTTILSARAGNVIGGGDWASYRLIPDIIAAFNQNKPVEIRNPNAVRPWQHVLEPLHGYMTLIESQYENPSPELGYGWNFGPDAASVWTVAQVVETMATTWGEGASWSCDTSEHAHEAAMLSLDSSKAKSQLGWQPLLNTQEALEWTTQWYRGWANGDDLLALTQQQIQHYQERIAHEQGNMPFLSSSA